MTLLQCLHVNKIITTWVIPGVHSVSEQRKRGLMQLAKLEFEQEGLMGHKARSYQQK